MPILIFNTHLQRRHPVIHLNTCFALFASKTRHIVIKRQWFNPRRQIKILRRGSHHIVQHNARMGSQKRGQPLARHARTIWQRGKLPLAIEKLIHKNKLHTAANLRVNPRLPRRRPLVKRDGISRFNKIVIPNRQFIFIIHTAKKRLRSHVTRLDKISLKPQSQPLLHRLSLGTGQRIGRV